MSQKLLHALPVAGAQRVLVIGDLILDEYLRGAVSRISPEAPVPVLESTSSEQALGGAANVANNLAALGVQVILCGTVGGDAAGTQLMTMLQERGVDISGVVVLPNRPTTHKLRVVSQVQHMLRIDREVKEELPSAVVETTMACVTRLLPTVHGVICSDYKKGFLSSALLKRLIAACRAAGVPMTVDPKGLDYRNYCGVDAVTPNLHEIQQATGITVADGATSDGLEKSADLDRAAQALFHLTQARAILVTCGKDGMVLFGPGARKVRINAEAREVYDVTGAGDTVIAAFSAAYFHGADVEDAARLANKAAGIVVAKLGTATVGRQELLTACDAGQGSTDSKLMTLAAAQDAMLRARARGQRIVFTNGCFDLLHAGHVQYLQDAKAMGDLLVVGLNSDSSVRALKGPLRPLVPEGERAQILAALACVDCVVLFDDPTPAAMVVALQPDILVKGADYTNKQVVGRDVVEAAGGRVELLPLVEGQSTSGLVRLILERYR